MMRIVLKLLALAALIISPILAHGATAPAVTTTAAVKAAVPAAPAPVPAVATPAPAPEMTTSTPATGFSEAQRAEIGDIIKDYLVNKNPEVLVEAMNALQKIQTTEATAKSKAAITTNRDKLFADAGTPVGGNPKGDVAVVEFFDYQCGYCKMSEPSVEKLLKEDKNVKFIYKDFPILGPVSTTAAKAALAAMRQGKYQQLHNALMNFKQHLTDDDVYKLAKESGLDMDKLKKDMNDDVIVKMVEANVTLGTDIGARGTPTFIIGDELFPGALQYDDLKKAVDTARNPSAASSQAPKKQP